MAKFDYSDGAFEKGEECVTLFVRANEHYGKAVAGDEVIVAIGELRNALRACETLAAKVARETEAAAKAAAAEAGRPQIVAMVEEGLARLRGEVSQPSLEGDAPAEDEDESVAGSVPPALADDLNDKQPAQPKGKGKKGK